MAHTDLILVASLFCWGSFCWLFMIHFGAVSAISNIRKEVFFRDLILELYSRSVSNRIFRVSLMALSLGFIKLHLPMLGTYTNDIYMAVTCWPLVRMY